MSDKENQNVAEERLARLPIKRARKASQYPITTTEYRFPDYATKEYGAAFKEGIRGLIGCLQGIEQKLESAYIVEEMNELKEANRKEIDSFSSEVLAYVKTFVPEDEERFHEWLDGLDSIVERYSQNNSCTKRAINQYCKLACNSNYADNIFTRKAFLDRAKDAADMLLSSNPDEKDFVNYVIKSINEERGKPFS